MSGLYQKASLDLLYDLINKDNPDLPYKVSKDTFVVHAGPTVLTPTVDAPFNTSVVMRGIQGAGYRGLITFRYNRIDLGNLFKDIKVVVTHYTANTYELLRPMFNSMYGMALDASEWNNSSFSNNASNTTFTLANTLGIPAATSSLAFIGRIPSFQWLRGTPDLSTLITNGNSVMKITPLAANKVDYSTRYRDIDFTPIRPEILNVYNSNSSASWTALATKLRALTGDPWVYTTSTVGFNLFAGSLSLQTTVAESETVASYFFGDPKVQTSICRIVISSSYCNNIGDNGAGSANWLMLPYN